MSKINITIKAVHIHMGSAAPEKARGVSFDTFLGNALGQAFVFAEREAGEAQPAAAQEPATQTPTAQVAGAEAQVAPIPTGPEIVDFLNSDDRYAKRTLGAIQKKFDQAQLGDLLYQLNCLKAEGDIQTTTRRRDNETLYEAT